MRAPYALAEDEDDLLDPPTTVLDRDEDGEDDPGASPEAPPQSATPLHPGGRPPPRAVVRQCDAQHALLPEEDESFDGALMDVPYGLGEHPEPAEILAYLGGADLQTGDFMGHGWDVPPVRVWREVYRVLRPGAHLLVYGGTRTFDLIALGIRMAGFEFRDTVAAEGVLRWYRGQGKPQGSDVGKMLDAAAGAEREVVGPGQWAGRESSVLGAAYQLRRDDGRESTAPATPLAAAFEDHHTLTKGLWEPVLVFRKPLGARTAAQCAAEHGTGALNARECRVRSAEPLVRPPCPTPSLVYGATFGRGAQVEPPGRFPPNVVLCHTAACRLVGRREVDAAGGSIVEPPSAPGKHTYAERQRRTPFRAHGEAGREVVDAWECAPGCPVAELDRAAGPRAPGTFSGRRSGLPSAVGYHSSGATEADPVRYDDSSAASRFFYQPRASSADRNRGCEHLLWVRDASRASGWRCVGDARVPAELAAWEAMGTPARGPSSGGSAGAGEVAASGRLCYGDLASDGAAAQRSRGNVGPCVKPLALGEWLGRLVRPPRIPRAPDGAPDFRGPADLPPGEPPPRARPLRALNLYSGTGGEALGLLLAGWDEVVCAERDPDFALLLRTRLAAVLADLGSPDGLAGPGDDPA